MASIFHIFVTEDPDCHSQYIARGEHTQASKVEIPDSEEFKTFLERLHERGPLGFQDWKSHEEACRFLGEALFSGLLTGDLLTNYRDYRDKLHPLAKRPRFGLHLPATLYEFPWELMRDPKDPKGQFLSMLGSVIRYSSDASKGDTLFDLPEDANLKLLLILANPDEEPIGNLSLDDTDRLKFEPVDPATYSNFISFTGKSALSYHGFLFVGHGETEPPLDRNEINLKVNREGVLVFVREERRFVVKRYIKDRRLGRNICDELVRAPYMRFAAVCACESAWIKGNLSFGNSVIGALVERTRIPFVLGMQNFIGIPATKNFIDAALQELEKNMTLDEAISAGRLAIKNINLDETTVRSAMDWWIPVLYARTDNLSMLVPPAPPRLPTPSDNRTSLRGEVSIIPSGGRELVASLTAVFKPLTGLFSDSDTKF
jgi:hypothetical protein